MKTLPKIQISEGVWVRKLKSDARFHLSATRSFRKYHRISRHRALNLINNPYRERTLSEIQPHFVERRREWVAGVLDAANLINQSLRAGAEPLLGDALLLKFNLLRHPLQMRKPKRRSDDANFWRLHIIRAYLIGSRKHSRP